MTCSVRNCQEAAETAVDFDPGKPGGWSSYPMEMPLCGEHAAQVADESVQWTAGSFDRGPEVLINEQLGELGEWVWTGAIKIGSGAISRRSSPNVPRLRDITLSLRLLGTDETKDLTFWVPENRMIELSNDLRKLGDS